MGKVLALSMELFSRRRGRLHQPKWYAAVVFMTKTKKYSAHLFDFWADPFVHLL